MAGSAKGWDCLPPPLQRAVRNPWTYIYLGCLVLGICIGHWVIPHVNDTPHLH